MNSSQDHQYIGACPVVPSKLCGYRQGEPSPYLVSRVLLEELDFRGFGNSRGQRSGAKHTGTLVVPSLSSRRNTTRGHHWVARLLPLRTTVAQVPRASIHSQHRVEYKDFSSIAHNLWWLGRAELGALGGVCNV